MSKAQDIIREALYGTGLVQPVTVGGRGGSVSILCRQLPGQESGWVKVIDQLLVMAEAAQIDLHVCRRYVRREGKMVFGWFLGVEAKNAASMVEAADKIAAVIRESSQPLAAPVQVAPAPPAPYLTDQQSYKNMTQDKIRHLTTARPRPPDRSNPDPVAPTNAAPRLKVIAQGRDEKGRPTDIVEMPLPHTYKDLNVPKEDPTSPLRWGKGAKATIGGGNGSP